MRGELGIIIQLGFAFFAVFSAFNSQGFVEITVLRDVIGDSHPFGLGDKSGYYSLAIIYLFFTLSNFLAPPLITIIGSKWCMVFGACTYTLFMLGFLCLSGPILYVLSALLGFGAALIWTGNGVYLIMFSSPGQLARNSGIMWAMLQSSLMAGAVFLYFVLNHNDLVSAYRIIYTAFAGISTVGIIAILLLPTPPKVDPLPPLLQEDGERLMADEAHGGIFEERPQVQQRTFFEEFKSTFALMRKRQMMRMSVCFFYSGLELTFFTGIYSACLASARQLNHGSQLIIAYNAFVMGIGQILGGFLFGVFYTQLPVRFSRAQVVIFAFTLHLTAYFLVFLNIPSLSPLGITFDYGYIRPSLGIALVTGFLLGLADSCWNTQIYTLIGAEWAENSPPAFALFKFFQSLAACLSFFYGSLLPLPWQLLILAVTGFAAALCFVFAHVENVLNSGDEDDDY